jgi:hypothetical protein
MVVMRLSICVAVGRILACRELIHLGKSLIRRVGLTRDGVALAVVVHGFETVIALLACNLENVLQSLVPIACWFWQYKRGYLICRQSKPSILFDTFSS